MKDENIKEDFLKFLSKAMNFDEIYEIDEDKLKILLNKLKELKITNFNKFIKIGAGTYSKVFKIKHYVIKIGLAKRKEEINNHSCIIKTYIRTNIKCKLKKYIMVVGFEIQEYAKNVKNINEEDLFKIYSLLRKDGFIWNDIKSSNVGKFKNRIVIIDTDDIYGENYKKIRFYTEYDKKFNDKYCKIK